MVNDRILLDAGAPLLPHMHRLGIDPAGIDVIFLSHFHGDHTLGLPTYVLHRAFVSQTPFTLVGPAGVEQRLERLFDVAWGKSWAEMRPHLEMAYVEAAGQGSVAGIDYETVRLQHGLEGCTGYRLWLDGQVLAYSGDTEATPELDTLVSGAQVAIVEATGPGDPYSHLSWANAHALRDRHPKTRFFFNHIYEGTIDGAASDLLVVEA